MDLVSQVEATREPQKTVGTQRLQEADAAKRYVIEPEAVSRKCWMIVLGGL